jgi:hypothetical protein
MTKSMSENRRASVIARSPFDFATLRSGQAPATKQSLLRAKIALLRCSETKYSILARRSWQPVIPGKAAGRDPESRNKKTGFPPARE